MITSACKRHTLTEMVHNIYSPLTLNPIFCKMKSQKKHSTLSSSLFVSDIFLITFLFTDLTNNMNRNVINKGP